MKRTCVWKCSYQGQTWQVVHLEEEGKKYPFAIVKDRKFVDGRRYQWLQDAVLAALELCFPEYQVEVWGKENIV